MSAYWKAKHKNWRNIFTQLKNDLAFFGRVVILDDFDCKVAYLHEPALNRGRLDDSSVRCFWKILREISDLCYNDHIYQLFILVFLQWFGPFNANDDYDFVEIISWKKDNAGNTSAVLNCLSPAGAQSYKTKYFSYH